MKQGDTIILDITDYGSNGEGIARHSGCVVFVPFAVVGEKVKARITYVKRSFAKAALIEIIEPSPLRVKPPCNRFMRCGGCDIMHIQYAEQLKLKRNALINTLKKNYKREVVVEDCVPSADVFAYRNKLMLHFSIVNGRVALGFFQEGTHKIVSITKCFLHLDWAQSLIKAVLEYANTNKISVYDEKSGKGLLRHLVARFIDGRLSITFVINGDSLPYSDKLISLLNNHFEDYSLYISINRNRNNVIMGDSVKLLSGNPLTADIRGIKYTLNPLSFLQVNNSIRDLIYDKVVDKVVKDYNSDVVIDAYAGVGLLGAMIAKEAIPVYNIEIIPAATEDADKLAKDNKVDHLVTNICGDAAEELSTLINALSNTYPRITIILDPPRKGCSAEVIAALNTLATNIDKNRQINYNISDKGDFDSLTIPNPNQIPQDNQTDKPLSTLSQSSAIDSTNAQHILTNTINLIYISCNPATLSRDLDLLSPNYRPTSITPYDMFPHTRHVEVLVCLSRKVI